jgi:hypothetical protein
MCRQVIVVLAESVPPSDRGWCRQVIVDKSGYPEDAHAEVSLPYLFEADRCRQVTVV